MLSPGDALRLLTYKKSYGASKLTPIRESGPLTRRWWTMRFHAGQRRYARSSPTPRYNLAACGRRSGKTEIAKRKLAVALMTCHRRTSRFFSPHVDPRFAACAPTTAQAKRIFWRDMKLLIPQRFWRRQPNESELVLSLVNGAELHVCGLARPQRIEGTPWDGIVLDEYADMEASAWEEHVRPMLVDRKGWCDLTGVPNGRNHYYDLWMRAQADEVENGAKSDWATHHWVTAEILDPAEVAKFQRDMDELTFQQEFEASFINFTGRAYWPFDSSVHANAALPYDSRAGLAFCFDFNREPGVAAVCQEQVLPNGLTGTAVIGEVWIPRGSNTQFVATRLITDWGNHEGPILLYGDPSGGAAGSAKLRGSDWDIIKEIMWDAFGRQRVFFRVPRASPRQRDRVNALNSRLRSVSGDVKLMVDPRRAPHVVRDFESVTLVEGGSGEIDKSGNAELTHLTDGIGYYVHREWPVRGHYATTRIGRFFQ